ncbi:Bardet-Biedl syndrome 1 protein homolog [Zootermopsis nevadensis]|uniref:Bardet-Biedl syndrome 1 protein n=1 Tax=Zootermopsis nevadensis TaxID=136037 RepID=A0A067RAV1_ZOONE|nr:Bardet-Biedl syndrome 1 protein homolog [Zootermopsis nevadensis]KDR20997.1 Bardet-Biedl syndrome 1 protein [Zootermopsis nevadensis]
MGSRGLSPQQWLDAFNDLHASIYTFSRCMTLADINADGDYRLITSDLGTGTTNIKLKVYKGTTLMSESTLMDVPAGVVTFHMDMNEPRVPAIAVASGPSIFVYKNMRPYFKFSLPSMNVNPLEQDLWLEVRNKHMEVEIFYELLQNLRQELGFSNLTSRSQQLLMLDHSNWRSFVDQYKDIPLKRQSVITCITTLKKSMTDEDAASCLVAGTENSDIYILDPDAFTILENMNLGGEGNPTFVGVPAHMAATGLHDVEFRIVVVCRDGCVYLVRRAWTQARPLMQLPAQAVAMVVLPGNSSIVLALMNEFLIGYTKKGKKQWELKLPSAATAMAPVPLHHLGLTLVAVALTGGTVNFYSGCQIMDTITASDTVSALLFGRFGQEDHSLILVTISGHLLVKILKRTAQFTAQSSGTGMVPPQQIKMLVPKKTKVFMEQTLRERENAVAMHQTFQHDLFRLRLNTARACVNALQSCKNPFSMDTHEPIKMSAQVLGLGPTFKIHITLENMSASNPVKDLAITFHCDDKLYIIEKPFIQVPLLVPGLTYKFESLAECIAEVGISDQVQIFIVKLNYTQPVMAAVINMPISDVLALV